MSVLIFFLVLFVLVLVHEWGHFITAKMTGMRVDEFGIGFPPKLFSVKKGETEYTFNALPIGGFVKIYGENSDAIADSDISRAFSSRPLWAQAVVLVAGVTMNVILAWLLFLVTLLMGVPTSVEESVASPEAVLYVSGVLAEGPLNGLMPAGSEIIKLASPAGEATDLTPTSFSKFIQDNANTPVDIYYRYAGEEEKISVEPEVGLIASAKEKAAVGVSLSMVETKEVGFKEAIVSASELTYTGLISITVGLFSLIVDSVKGTADFTQVAGPIGIVGMVGDAATFGLTALLTFTAMISLNLAVINMLPIPALDGGRLVFVLIEAITKKPINPVWVGRVNLIGFVLLMVLMVIVTWNDIARLI
jgi:regulator of sigma E protease